MNFLTRIRVMNRVRDEILSGIESGQDSETAAEAAIEKVQAEFVKPGDHKSAIDWATILPLIMQLITMIVQLFPKKP